ncbi:MAG: SCO family protein [Acidiferrobacterales bacterium]
MNRNSAVALALSVFIALMIGIGIGHFDHRGLRLPFMASSSGEMTTLRPPRALAAFTLYDTHHHVFGLPQLRGRWSFVYFGYTHCDDVCPATLRTLKQVYDLVGGKTHDIQYVFVSVDPTRDTPKVLAHYLQQFNRGFVGVTGTNHELGDIAHQMGAYYMPHSRRAGANYNVGHSDELFLVDPEARLRAVFSSPERASTLAHDLDMLRAS